MLGPLKTVEDFKPLHIFVPPAGFKPKESILIDPDPAGVDTPKHHRFYYGKVKTED